MLRQKMAHSQKRSGRAVFSAASHCLPPQLCNRSAFSTQPSERPVLSPHFTSSLFRSAAWLAVLIAVAGLYLLCMTDGSFSLQKGDLLVLACALGFTIHILVIDHFSPLVDGIKMSCIQFFTCSILSAVCMALFETVNVSNLLHAWIPILYAGFLSSGVGYTLQIIGQKGLNPTMASLLMSLESVFSVLAGWIFLHQALSGRELSGCILMFAAIVLVQLPGFSKTSAVS